MPVDILEPTIGTSETGFLTPQDVFGVKPLATQFTDAVTGGFKSFTDLFTPKPQIDTTISNVGRTNLSLTPKPGQLPSGNVIVGGATILGTAALGTVTLSNPGVQSTLSNTSQNLANLGQSTQKTFGPLLAGIGDAIKITSQSPFSPLILVAGIALLAVVALKK